MCVHVNSESIWIRCECVYSFSGDDLKMSQICETYYDSNYIFIANDCLWIGVCLICWESEWSTELEKKKERKGRKENDWENTGVDSYACILFNCCYFSTFIKILLNLPSKTLFQSFQCLPAPPQLNLPLMPCDDISSMFEAFLCTNK